MKRKKITDKDIADAKRLKSVWESKKSELKLTQESAGELMGGLSQGAVGQYLNGITRLNIATKVKFATILKVPIKDIWPDFQYSTGENFATSDELMSDDDQLLEAVRMQLQVASGEEGEDLRAALRFFVRKNNQET